MSEARRSEPLVLSALSSTATIQPGDLALALWVLSTPDPPSRVVLPSSLVVRHRCRLGPGRGRLRRPFRRRREGRPRPQHRREARRPLERHHECDLDLRARPGHASRAARPVRAMGPPGVHLRGRAGDPGPSDSRRRHARQAGRAGGNTTRAGAGLRPRHLIWRSPGTPTPACRLSPIGHSARSTPAIQARHGHRRPRGVTTGIPAPAVAPGHPG